MTNQSVTFNTQPSLATRMKPRTILEVVGQDHLITNPKTPDKKGIISKMLEDGFLPNMILYGRPGTGKTSMARAITTTIGQNVHYFNAGVHTKKDLQDIVKKSGPGSPAIAIIDEIHRLDKGKQDFLLLNVESGQLVMIGATTENPQLSVNPALRSRSTLFELNQPTSEDVKTVIRRALDDHTRGVALDVPGYDHYTIDPETLEDLAHTVQGDIRNALGIIQMAVHLATPKIDESGNPSKTLQIERSDVEQATGHLIQVGIDKDGNGHYDILSAFQKSIRGSDVDASLHYLARLIIGGDLESITRRLRVIAYEDIGLADPDSVRDAIQAIEVAYQVGLPEARIPLSHAVIRLALSEKSNHAYRAIDYAIKDLQNNQTARLDIPNHLKDAHFKGAKQMGHGVGYKYPHDYAYGVTNQQYAPDDLKDRRYFRPHSEDEPLLEGHALQELLKRANTLRQFIQS